MIRYLLIGYYQRHNLFSRYFTKGFLSTAFALIIDAGLHLKNLRELRPMTFKPVNAVEKDKI